MPNKDLSRKQKEILEFIEKYMARKNHSPSIREIANGVYLNSPATVHIHVQNLIQKGYLKRDESTQKSLVLMVENPFDYSDDQAIRVPFIDRYVHKNILKKINEPEEYFYLTSRMIPQGVDVFVIRIRDNSLIDKGILEDDFGIFEKVDDAFYDDVVALINDDKELVIKLFHYDDTNVFGRLIGIYREY